MTRRWEMIQVTKIRNWRTKRTEVRAAALVNVADIVRVLEVCPLLEGFASEAGELAKSSIYFRDGEGWPVAESVAEIAALIKEVSK